MKRVYKILASLVVILCVFTVPVFADGDVFRVEVPNWGGWSKPSPKLRKSTTDSSGVMICIYSGSWMLKYGDFTNGGTSTRISKDYYALVDSSNTGNAGNWKNIYYKSGYNTVGRSVSARACSSNIEPNTNSGTFSWDTDNEKG